MMKTVVRRFSDLVVALAVIAGLDGVVFHGGLYRHLVEPESYSGRTERTARRLAWTRDRVARPLVLVLGDSTTASAVLEQELRTALEEAGHRFEVVNVALGGSTPRTWTHLMSHVEPWRSAASLLVLGIHPDSIREFPDETKPDLEIVKTRLRARDVAWLPGTYGQWDDASRAALGSVFRMPLFRPDVVGLLSDPVARWRVVQRERQWPTRWQSGWRPENQSAESLAGVQLGADHALDMATVPEELRARPADLRDLERVLRRRERTQGQRVASITPTNSRLVRALLEFERDRRVPVVVALTPWSPYPTSVQDLSCFDELVRDARSTGIDVELFPGPGSMADLERPEYFRDLLHLNREGALRFTGRLASFILDRGVPGRTPAHTTDARDEAGATASDRS